MTNVSEFEFAAAVLDETSTFRDIVQYWETRDRSGGFSPYGHTVNSVLSGCVNQENRTQILEKIRSYKLRMQPERNAAMTELTWELFDSMGGDVSGAAPYTFNLTNIEIKIRGGYLYRFDGLEYYIVNWFTQRSPSEKLIRSILDVLEISKPPTWTATRIPALLIADEQNLRIANPLPPRKKTDLSDRLEAFRLLAS